MSEKPPAAKFTTERRDHAIVARANAKVLAEDDFKTLSRLIDEAVATAPASVIVIDLSGVQFLPSLALGLLTQISSKCKARQQSLKLACVDPKIRQVFAITRLDRIFEFVASVDAAI